MENVTESPESDENVAGIAQISDEEGDWPVKTLIESYLFCSVAITISELRIIPDTVRKR